MKEILVLKENINIISQPKDIFKHIQKINIDFQQENFIVIYLDCKNKILNSEVLFKGGLTECAIDSKTIFRKALINNANSIIVAHNHPSGDLHPSKDDFESYEILQKAGKIIRLKVLDDIIFNKTEYYSLNN